MTEPSQPPVTPAARSTDQAKPNRPSRRREHLARGLGRSSRSGVRSTRAAAGPRGDLPSRRRLECESPTSGHARIREVTTFRVGTPRQAGSRSLRVALRQPAHRLNREASVRAHGSTVRSARTIGSRSATSRGRCEVGSRAGRSCATPVRPDVLSKGPSGRGSQSNGRRANVLDESGTARRSRWAGLTVIGLA